MFRLSPVRRLCALRAGQPKVPKLAIRTSSPLARGCAITSNTASAASRPRTVRLRSVRPRGPQSPTCSPALSRRCRVYRIGEVVLVADLVEEIDAERIRKLCSGPCALADPTDPQQKEALPRRPDQTRIGFLHHITVIFLRKMTAKCRSGIGESITPRRRLLNLSRAVTVQAVSGAADLHQSVRQGDLVSRLSAVFFENPFERASKEMINMTGQELGTDS